jgi:NAD(P)H dehydrogenase (quinone)
MRHLIVFAHPRGDSFSAALRHAVVDTLAHAGHQVELLDLNDSGFDPVLSAEARGRYFEPGRNVAGLEEEVARLKRAQALVLVFPVWWFGFPAILKGWFDRVWLPGVAFEVKRSGLDGQLHNIVQFTTVTTYGSPRWYIRLVMRDPIRRIVKRGLAALCHPGCHVEYLALYHMDRASERRRRRFLARVRRRLARRAPPEMD